MTDLLLPQTDGGVLAQLVIVTVAGPVLLWLVRHRPEVRVLAAGALITAYAAMGLRALH